MHQLMYNINGHFGGSPDLIRSSLAALGYVEDSPTDIYPLTKYILDNHTELDSIEFDKGMIHYSGKVGRGTFFMSDPLTAYVKAHNG
jgi:hypothetical protein